MSRDSLTGDDATVDRYASSASAFRGLPGDLILLVAYTVLVGSLIGFAPDSVPPTFRFVIGIPLLVFVPGYSLLAALFPGRPSRNAGQVSSLSGMSRRYSTMRSIQQRGVRWGERVALSFGLSLFLIPLLALALDLTPFLFRTGPIVATLVVFSLALASVGIVRRLRLPRAQRFGAPLGYWLEDLTDGLTGAPIDALLNVVLILSVLVAAASMSYALAVPRDGEAFTSLYVGTQDGSGEVVLENYPQNFTVDQPEQLTVGVENHERRPTNYTVVIQLQRTDDAGNVLAREELDRLRSPTVPDNRTWQQQHTVAPTVAEDQLKLTYLLYRGDPPQNPTERNAYEETHIWINASGGGGGGG